MSQVQKHLLPGFRYDAKPLLLRIQKNTHLLSLPADPNNTHHKLSITTRN